VGVAGGGEEVAVLAELELDVGEVRADAEAGAALDLHLV
jgi:hypothetical protein